MPTPYQHLQFLDRNTDIPFFPHLTWVLTNSDLGTLGLFTFNWIQAFWDVSTFSGTQPQLVVDSGYPNPVTGTTGNTCSIVPFAYSGERINIKGRGLVSSGYDCRGVLQTSTPLGTNHAADLLLVVAWGGAQ